MSESKHSRGPWRCKEDNGKWCSDDDVSLDCSGSWLTVKSGSKTIAAVIEKSWNDERMEANAHLIAAAPELLAEVEVLRETVAHILGDPALSDISQHINSDDLKEIGALINRAKGGAE